MYQGYTYMMVKVKLDDEGILLKVHLAGSTQFLQHMYIKSEIFLLIKYMRVALTQTKQKQPVDVKKGAAK